MTGIGNPGDHPLQHVVVIELAGHPAGALRLRPVADLGREGDDFDGAVGPAEIAVGDRRITAPPGAALMKPIGLVHDRELAIPGVGRRLPGRAGLARSRSRRCCR